MCKFLFFYKIITFNSSGLNLAHFNLKLVHNVETEIVEKRRINVLCTMYIVQCFKIKFCVTTHDCFVFVPQCRPFRNVEENGNAVRSPNDFIC